MCNFTCEIINSCRKFVLGYYMFLGGPVDFFGGPVDFLIHPGQWLPQSNVKACVTHSLFLKQCPFKDCRG